MKFGIVARTNNVRQHFTPDHAAMPTFRKVKTKTQGTKWRAEVWIDGQRVSARFNSKPKAVAWAYQKEAEIASDGRLVPGQTFAAAMDRYASEVTPTKKGARSEAVRIKRLKRDPIANVLMADMSVKHANDYRDRRLKEVMSSSVSREMNLMASIIKQSIEWNWLDVYPWAKFKWPKKVKSRSKVYSQKEIEAIKSAAGVTDDSEILTRKHQTVMAFLFSIETAARQGEITSLQWDDIDLDRGVATVRRTKNGEDRELPLSVAAKRIIERMPRHHVRPWPLSSDSASVHFREVRLKAGIKDATFHDARRTACTRLAEKLTVMNLAKVSGHKDVKMLLEVYYEPDVAALARQLD